MINKTLTTKSLKETKNLGEALGRQTKKGVVLTLYGDLGGGKTTFIQGFAKGLGIKTRITSPTFIILRSYKLKENSFFHIDLYRIQDENDIKGIGLEELLNSKEDVIAIEWAEKLGKFLPKKRIDVFFEEKGEHKRKISIKKIGFKNE